MAVQTLAVVEVEVVAVVSRGGEGGSPGTPTEREGAPWPHPP